VRVRRTVHTDGIQYRIVHMPPIAQERCVLCSCASAQLQPCFLGASGIGGERRLRGGSGDGRSVREERWETWSWLHRWPLWTWVPLMSSINKS